MPKLIITKAAPDRPCSPTKPKNKIVNETVEVIATYTATPYNDDYFRLLCLNLKFQPEDMANIEVRLSCYDDGIDGVPLAKLTFSRVKSEEIENVNYEKQLAKYKEDCKQYKTDYAEYKKELADWKEWKKQTEAKEKSENYKKELQRAEKILREGGYKITPTKKSSLKPSTK